MNFRLLFIVLIVCCRLFGQAQPVVTPAQKPADAQPATLADSTTLKDLREKCRNTTKKEVYTVAMFLPIYAKENNFNDKYTVGAEFYEGALMGMEDYKGDKLKLQVEVFDTENDTINIKDILKKVNLKKYDLVIGPLFASAFQIVANKAKADSVVCVSPFSQVFKVISGLPNVHKITPSAVTIIDQSAQYIARYHGRHNVIFITNNIKKDAGTLALYRQRLENAFGKYNYTFKEYNFTGGTIPEALLSPLDENFFVFPGSDQAQVGLFIDQLDKLANKYIVKVWGLNQWQNYDNLQLDKLTRLNLHFARTSYADSNGKLLADVNRRCRDKYKADAGEYFLQGYDIATFYIAMLEKYGTAFGRCVLCENEFKGLQTDIQFGGTTGGHGLENMAIQVMQYKNDDIIIAND